jgi:EAL domain-containing protein (putative c-di-GMP-specific phosphodiesterase class I)
VSSFEFIKAFVDMAHALKLLVVAEGIENAETLALLQESDCDGGQGYYLARPLPIHELQEFLASLERNKARTFELKSRTLVG